MSSVTDHFINLRSSLLAMYADSKSANHTVVTGSLREAFIRSILVGHLPSTASWSTGQMVGHAPNNDRSGQLDLILHSGELPQIHIHDGFIRLVPSDACIAVIEVKSDLTTGDSTKSKPRDVLSNAMSSLVGAKDVPRQYNPNNGSNSITSRVPFHLIAFTSKVSAKKVIDSVHSYLNAKGKNIVDYWPDSIVVLEGAKKTAPNGYGIFKYSSSITFPSSATSISPTTAVTGLALKQLLDWEALAALVALLANDSVAFQPNSFKLEKYIFS